MSAGYGDLPFLQVDRSEGTPLARQLFVRLREAIEQGRITNGFRLPSTRDLARDLGVARNTVLTAYDLLAAHGLAESRIGAGTLVTDRAPTPSRAAEPSPQPKSVFRLGVPPLDVFPVREWLRMMSLQLRRPIGSLVAEDPAGALALRRALAQHLGAFRGVRCDAAQIVITAGEQQALQVIARALDLADRRVWIEDPGCRDARRTFADFYANTVGVPVDGEGIDVEAGMARAADASAAFVTPARQFPTGVSMSSARRWQLINWANRSGAWIVENDFEGELELHGRSTQSLQGQFPNAPIIYVGTVAPLLAPLVRIAFIVAPRALSRRMIEARELTGDRVSEVDQAMLACFIETGRLANYIRALRAELRRRQEVLLRELAGQLRGFIRRVSGTEGGLRVLLTLRSTCDATAISNELLRRGVEAPTLSSFAIEAATPPALLLGYACIHPDDMGRAVAELRAALEKQAA